MELQNLFGRFEIKPGRRKRFARVCSKLPEPSLRVSETQLTSAAPQTETQQQQQLATSSSNQPGRGDQQPETSAGVLLKKTEPQVNPNPSRKGFCRDEGLKPNRNRSAAVSRDASASCPRAFRVAPRVLPSRSFGFPESCPRRQTGNFRVNLGFVFLVPFSVFSSNSFPFLSLFR